MKKFIFPIATEFDLQLPYYFAGVGVDYEQEHIQRPTGHPDYQWIQCREGKGKLILHGKTYVLESGHGMFLFPREPHEYYALTPSWTVDWIIFKGREIEPFIHRMLNMTESKVWEITAPHLLAGKLEELYRTAHSSSPTRNLICSSLVYSLLMDLLRLISSDQSPSLANRFGKLTEVLSLIERSYDQPISLSELASLANLSPQYFCSVFKKATSQTPVEYMNMVRIRKSKEYLLNNKEIPIKEIACRVGFNDVSYFCSLFRRLEGMSPSEFRALHH